MAKNEYTEDEKTRIIDEYQKAVAEGKGGGSAVARQYGVHSANIIGWAKSRGKVIAGKTRRPPPPPAPVGEVNQLRARVDADLDALISYYETQALNLRRLREGALA